MISEASRKLWEEVKENHRRQEACPKHHFTYDKVQIGKPIECDNCGGTMQFTDAGMYVKGYMAAGGNADDVWPGWFTKRQKL
jgi:hypothetical protein